MKRFISCATLLLWFFLTTTLVSAQSKNLILNPGAEEGATQWRAFGDTAVERTSETGSHFRVRNKGYFLQDVALPEGAVGKYVLLIGRVSSERINADGAITGLPYLYGYMMESTTPRGEQIKSYLQGQLMLCAAGKENEWTTAWGIFQVSVGTDIIRFFLNQAERKDVPQNGSAARFDDLGLYLFDTAEEASTFVKSYNKQKQ